jgi:hypothetical protein
MTTTGPPEEPQIPDLGPLVDGLLGLASTSLQRTSDQALAVWKEVTSGDYETKYLVRDTALFWSGAATDVAKTFVLVRDFLMKIANDNGAAPAK